jgi:hypothetical protein
MGAQTYGKGLVWIDRAPNGPRLYLGGMRIHHGLGGELLTADALRRRGRLAMLEAVVGLALLASDWHDFPFALTDR